RHVRRLPGRRGARVPVLSGELVVVGGLGRRGPRPIGRRAGGRGRAAPGCLAVPEVDLYAVAGDPGVGVVCHDVEVHRLARLSLLRLWRDGDGEWLIGAGIGVPAEGAAGGVVAVTTRPGGRNRGSGRRRRG